MCFKSRKKNLLKLMECVFNSETDTDCYVFISRIHYPNVSLHTHCTYNIKHWRWGSLKPNCSFNFLLIFLTLAPLYVNIKPADWYKSLSKLTVTGSVLLQILLPKVNDEFSRPQLNNFHNNFTRIAKSLRSEYKKLRKVLVLCVPSASARILTKEFDKE